jgi:TonB family protein
MKIKLFMVVLLVSRVCLAQTVSTKGESLDKVQVLALLAGDVPHSRVASLVVERGITFSPTDRYIQLLQKANADDGVIAAVRVAQRPPAGPKAESASSENGPVERDQILDLLQTGVGSDVLAKLVVTRGIDFEPFDEYLHAYKIAGAQENLLSALRQAGQLKAGAAPATVAPPKVKEGRPSAAGTIPKRVRMAGETESARLIFQPKPEYPPLATMGRIQGMVRLRAIIAKDGTIDELKVLSGHPLLVKSAMDAVPKWRYQPLLLNGTPVEVETEIDVNYTLSM